MATPFAFRHAFRMTPDQWFEIAGQAIGVVLAAGAAEWVRVKMKRRADRETESAEQDSDE